MQPPSGRPWILGHRGASATARENTIEAFHLAAEMGADGVELDARRTVDGAIVVHHDDRVDGTPIVSLSLVALREAWPHVPTLEEALAACRGMWVNVEVKSSSTDADWDPADSSLEAVLDVIDQAGVDVEVSSFNPLTVYRSLQLRPDLPTGWLTERSFVDPFDAITAAASAGHTAIHPDLASFDDDAGAVVRAAHTAGLWAIAWTVDEPDDITRLADAGIDGIITNVPDVAMGVLG